MNSTNFSKILYESLINGFVMVFKVLWSTNEFKSVVIGISISIITFRIVGRIFSYGRAYGVWFGSMGGKIIYYLINTFLVWLVMKIV